MARPRVPRGGIADGRSGATLIAVAALAAVWAASGLLRERSLAIAVLLVAAGCWLGAIVVAHVAAGVAARVAHRSGTSR